MPVEYQSVACRHMTKPNLSDRLPLKEIRHVVPKECRTSSHKVSIEIQIHEDSL